ncbi:unnamed protein product [Closterium sp. Naga37s-1]|nr:unnamed protein product [Closterium sp. Naga37s-1]
MTTASAGREGKVKLEPGERVRGRGGARRCGGVLVEAPTGVGGCVVAVDGWDEEMDGWDEEMDGWDEEMDGWDEEMDGWDEEMDGWDEEMDGWDEEMDGWDEEMDEWDVDGCLKATPWALNGNNKGTCNSSAHRVVPL